MMHIKRLPIRFFRPLFRVRVLGESAWPELVSGKRYWASGWPAFGKGDWVVFRNPAGNASSAYVKRVEEETEQGYRVGGSVSWASSSREFGPVPHSSIFGKILFK